MEKKDLKSVYPKQGIKTFIKTLIEQNYKKKVILGHFQYFLYLFLDILHIKHGSLFQNETFFFQKKIRFFQFFPRFVGINLLEKYTFAPLFQTQN